MRSRINLAIWVGAEMQKMMEGRQDLPTFQGNSSWMLPIPATFVVGRDGRIKARFIGSRLPQAHGDRRIMLRGAQRAERQFE